MNVSEAAAGPVLAGHLLDHLALLTVEGVDAVTFLDAQLTRNVPRVLPGEPVSKASLAGYCSPKGRLLASLVIWSDPDRVWLLVSADIAAALVKRLRMYVLRAKVAITDVTGQVPFVGRSGSADGESVWDVTDDGACRTVRFPDADGLQRSILVGAAGGQTGDCIDAAHWRWSEIRAGLPRIMAATQDRWVPQMLNLEALGAVDFKKGCFPGQEVVARSQYLGKLKRRTALAGIADAVAVPEPGSDIWDAADPAEPVGLVVNAERGPDGGIALLVELPLNRFQSTTLRAVSLDGAPLILEALPYPLPDNEVFVRPRL